MWSESIAQNTTTQMSSRQVVKIIRERVIAAIAVVT